MAEDKKPKRWMSKGHLTTKARESMPKSDFALPGKGSGAKGSGSGSYPIPDASHARNALARVSQFGSSEQKAEVRAAVHRKFPAIGRSKGSLYKSKD